MWRFGATHVGLLENESPTTGLDSREVNLVSHAFVYSWLDSDLKL